MSDTASIQETAIEYERARRNAKRIVDAEQQGARPPLRAFSLAELFDRPAPQYLIDRVIPEAGLVQTVGEPGSFKTFFMLDVALSVAANSQKYFHGYPVVKHGAVLFIAAEGAGAFPHRVRVWCQQHGVDPLTIPFRVIAMPVNLRDPRSQKELHAIVAEMRPILIVVDTRARCTPGADENSAKDMGEVINFCSELQEPSGATIAFTQHPAKGDPGGGGRGSGVVFGALDTEFRITTNDKLDGAGSRLITVRCAKQKDDLVPEPLTLSGSVVSVCDSDGREILHESGRPITSIVLGHAVHSVAVNQNEATEKSPSADHEIDLKVLRMMKECPAATSQQKLRARAGLNSNAVTDAVGRILKAGWALQGKRGKPYEITDAGLQTLKGPPS